MGKTTHHDVARSKDPTLPAAHFQSSTRSLLSAMAMQRLYPVPSLADQARAGIGNPARSILLGLAPRHIRQGPALGCTVYRVDVECEHSGYEVHLSVA